MKKKLLAVILSAMMVVSLAGCGKDEGGTTTTNAAGETGTTGQAGDTFKLGAFLQLSGSNSAYGIEARNAIQLAIDYINETAGGFNGKKVELVPYDTQGSAEEAVKVVTKLMEVDKVNAVIGSVNSSEVLAAARYLNENGVYTIGLGTSPTWMAEDWPFIFRASMNNNTAVPLTIDIAEKLGFTKIAMFYGQDDASLVTSKNFSEQCETRGIEIVASESYDTGDTDYSAQIANILKSEPHAVYISVIGETGPTIVKQLRQYGYSGIILDKESFMNSQIEIAGADNSNYITFANPYVTYESVEACDIPNMKEFLQKYSDKYGEVCKTDSAYRGWDTVMVMWEASKIAASNESDALREATHKISGLEGLGGTLDYTSGNREGYNAFNSFILVDRKNILLDKWIEDGGYDAYKAATGNQY